jgi:glycerol-3-phosphate cytidylyltransferase
MLPSIPPRLPRVVLTYGTFDLFHAGHLRFLNRAREFGDRLIVGVSTDGFNAQKGKRAYVDFSLRLEIVGALPFVDAVFPETCWEQKRSDIARYKAATFVIGSDWAGEFDHLRDLCEVVYLPRTEGVSSTGLREQLADLRHREAEKTQRVLEIFGAAIQIARSDRRKQDIRTVHIRNKYRQDRLFLFRMAEKAIS